MDPWVHYTTEQGDERWLNMARAVDVRFTVFHGTPAADIGMSDHPNTITVLGSNGCKALQSYLQSRDHTQGATS